MLRICFFFILLSVCITNNSCNKYHKFHEGIFLLQEDRGIRIQRYKDKQVEYIGDSIVCLYSIKWISKRQYNLMLERVEKNSQALALPSEKDTVYVSIRKIIGNSSYTYSSYSKLNPTKFTGTLMKVKFQK